MTMISGEEPRTVGPLLVGDVRNATIGFIGLGVMGGPMVRNVHAAGFDVRVYDIATGALAGADADGLRVTTELAALVAGSDVVVTMLPDTPQVEEIVNGPGGIAAAGRPGMVHIDMSTISPIASADLAAKLATAGITMIDGPVSGGVQKAISGELSIMVGGDSAVLDSVRPLLDAMGTATWMGGPGAGQATKACNQVAVAIGIQAIAEAFTLGSKLGLDLDRLFEALRGGSCNSFLLENLGPLMLAGDDDPGFRIALQVKDLKIANDSALQTATPLPGTHGVLDLYLDAIANGQSADGNQSLARVYERHAGARIGRRPPTG